MPDNNDSVVLNHLLELKQDVGQVQGTLTNLVDQQEAFNTRLVAAEKYQNTQRGSARVWNLVVNTAVGLAAAFIGVHVGK